MCEEDGLPIEYKSEVMAYSALFDFFFQEHGLTLLNSEMDDIIKAVDAFKKQFNAGLFPDDGLVNFDPAFSRLRKPKKAVIDKRAKVLQDSLVKMPPGGHR